MTENARQEIELSIGGRKYAVRPTFKTVAAIEQAAGQGCVPLGLKVARSQATLTEVALILNAMVHDQPGAPTPEEIGEHLMEDGLFPLIDPVSEFLLRALRGNKEHAKATAKKEKEAGGDAAAHPPPRAVA